MKKFLILVLIICMAVGGLAVWLAGKANDSKPEPGPVRLELQDVL